MVATGDSETPKRSPKTMPKRSPETMLKRALETTLKRLPETTLSRRYRGDRMMGQASRGRWYSDLERDPSLGLMP